MPWARFLFMGGPQERVADRPQMGRWRHTRRACGQSDAGGTACESCAGKGKTDVFLFLGGKIGGRLPILWVEAEIGPQLSRPWGTGTAAKTMRARVAVRGGAQCGNPACGGLTPWRPAAAEPSLSSLYTLDTYVGA